MIVQLYVLDERFQLYCGINWCFMHQATIGLFGHLVKAVIYKVEITLRNDSYVQGKTREGEPKHFISMSAFDGVWTRLCRRLTHVSSDVSGLQLTPKYAAHVRHVFIDGKSTFTAGRLELLMMVLPFMLVDLIEPELRSIEHAIAENKIDRDTSGRRQAPPVDPCPDMIRALACFLDWYMKARLLLFPVQMAPDLQRSVKVWKEVAEEVFWRKSGQNAGWNFPKMHAPDHKGSEIMANGSTIFTETGPFETGHKQNIKDLSGNSNGKDQFITIAKFHDRASNVTKLKQAIARNSRFLSRENESDSGSSSNSSADEEDDDMLTDEITSRPCEMAIRMPLWDMTYHLEDLRRETFSMGTKGMGRQRLLLSTCKPGTTARSQSSSKGKAPAPKFVYNPAVDKPELRYLPAQLGHFCYEYLQNSLGLPDVPEAERDINGVLERCLVRDSDGTDIHTIGGLAIRSHRHKGTVRVRARPFASDTFFGKNPQVFAR